MNAISPGNVAVVTGAAGGIGLAAAKKFAAAGMQVCLVDRSDSVRVAAGSLGGKAAPFIVDVADRSAMERLAEEIRARFGAVSVLMNNAAIGDGGDVLASPENWERLLGVNLFGVLHGVQAFLPAMVAGDRPGIVINTGSKQGITQPPGDTAYNVSKSAVKALTEGLAHTLRQQVGERITAHLLIPGYTFTGLTKAAEKPAGAWTAEQVVDFMFERMAEGDFYILCPDNDVTREMDEKRMAWAMGDVIGNRPALSRWHPDWQDAFADYMKS
ncbi:short-chain dehydrogenase [Azorhizobium oxalatiphilum]|uniref:Short-chain dehydrogenase n=1 Tax=Azorhizobium oxalatiphilum TaxID=980631 RepID=A0A917C5Q3_9HYPH|nr:SDR family NAD(P)-dependent oxidoreductase [Azorhizobium oxalatiphilum]GGF73299.1 short-chain dehydrogenase [Azorhizobium oxalatiphilum]